MSLPAGSRIGPYEVVAPLGAGGMGDVYRARDTRLDRDVALKILPESFAADPDRVMRFDREAKTLAALNHPFIAHIYGIEDRALVMELVDGDTLADRIARGPIPVDEAVTIARQIAEALEAAHQAGIVHRDLKPANLKVRPDGTVKVLDFGLAKAGGAGAAGRARGDEVLNLETLTSPAMTMQGVILGTAAYMAPEQARGKPVDKRADIWAFGVVLYEMLTGRTLFAADSVAETIGFVVTRAPDWTALPPETPVSVRRVLHRCLQKEPRQRLHDMGDVRVELDAPDEPPGLPSPAAATLLPRSRTRERVAWGLVATLALMVIALSARAWLTPQPAPTIGQTMRFAIAPPDGHRFGGQFRSLALSPDGRMLAFVATSSSSLSHLFVRPLSSLTTEPVRLPTSVANAAWAAPSWSPDSRYLLTTAGTSSGGPVRKIDPTGGPSIELAAWGTAATWGSADVVVYTGRDGRLYRVAHTGGESTPFRELDAARGETAQRAIGFLPDGRRFLLLIQNRDRAQSAVYVASIDTAERTLIPGVGPLAQYAAGHLWFVRDTTLMVQPFDADAGRLTGDPVVSVEDVEAFTVSESGVLIYLPRDRSTVAMTWLDETGTPTEAVGPPGAYRGVGRPDISADGRRMVFAAPDASGRTDVWMLDLERNIPLRLTAEGDRNDAPRFSPDGSHVVFSSNRGGNLDLYMRAADGSGADELLYASTEFKVASGFSPDGQLLLFWQNTPDTAADVMLLPLQGERKPAPFAATRSLEGFAAFSPDGRWIAYCSGEAGEGDHVYVEPYPRTGARTRLSATAGSSPIWSANGREIYFGTPEGQIVRVEVTVEGGAIRAGAPRPLFTAPAFFVHNSFAIDPTRRRFLTLSGQPGAAGPPDLTVLLNTPTGSVEGTR